MIFIIKIILVVSLVAIAYQDYKQRMVYAFLFAIVGLCVGMLHYQNTSLTLFLKNTSYNIIFVGSIIGVLWIYATFKLKISLFKEAFGVGDAFMFLALTLAFPVFTFMILLCFGFLACLLLSIPFFFKKTETVPLAGQLSAFFIMVYVISWQTSSINLYLI